MVERYGITEHDRFSQTFDLTFDLSVFDMFVAWERGACLCCPPEKALMTPGALHPRRGADRVVLASRRPAVFMRRLAMLKPGHATRRLRWSLFCGEPLPVEVAARVAGRRAGLDRREPLRPDRADDRLHAVPRGTASARPRRPSTASSRSASRYPGCARSSSTTTLREVAPGEAGELLHDRPAGDARLLARPGADRRGVRRPARRATEIYYRTGDRVRRPLPTAAR